MGIVTLLLSHGHTTSVDDVNILSKTNFNCCKHHQERNSVDKAQVVLPNNIRSLFTALVSDSWYVQHVRCFVEVKSLFLMKPQPRWTWKLMNSFNKRFGGSLLTARFSLLLTGSTPSWITIGKRSYLQCWLCSSLSYALYTSHLQSFSTFATFPTELERFPFKFSHKVFLSSSPVRPKHFIMSLLRFFVLQGDGP